MSTTGPITAVYMDPMVENIRNSVRQRADAIPYMLLPVRIETRFRIVMPSYASAANPMLVENALQTIGRLHLDTIEVMNTNDPQRLQNLSQTIAAIPASMQTDEPILIREMGWIKKLMNGLKKDLRQVMENRVLAAHTDMAKLQEVLDGLDASLKKIKLKEDPESAPVKSIISRMTRMLEKLSALTGERKKIPYLNIKNKKDLYTYIGKSVKDLEKFYSGIHAELEAISHIDKNQVKKIDELHRKLEEQSQLAIQHIEGIHADKHWKKFATEEIAPRLKGLGSDMNRFAMEGMTRIQAAAPLPTLKSGELLVHGIELMVKLKKYNTNPSTGFEKHKHFRLYLRPGIDTLTKAISQPVKEDKPGHKEMLFNMYHSLTGHVQEAAGQLSGFRPKNKSQLHGIGMVNSFLKSSMEPTLAALSGGQTPSFFPQVTINSAGTSSTYQLMVRIFPDDIFMDTHEPALTQAEQEGGRRFWKTWWAASADKDLEKAAWKTLCTAFGARRASWIARSLKPDFENNAQNRTALANRPVARLLTANALVNSAGDGLRALPVSGTAPALFQAPGTLAALNLANAQFANATSHYRSFTTMQDYLLEKYDSICSRTGAALNALIEKRAQLTTAEAAQVAATLTALQNCLLSFNAMAAVVNNIGRVDHKEYITRLAEPFQYPAVASKAEDWTRAPAFSCMPDRFVAATIRGGQFQHVYAGNPIPAGLKAGLDPAKFSNPNAFSLDSQGNLVVDPDIKWMTDYNEAVSKGMAITIPLNAYDLNTGFDQLVVLGIRSGDRIASKTAIENLFTNHIYGADGMEFLKVGTPTNNTHYRKSGFDPDGDEDQRFEIEVANNKFSTSTSDVYATADGKILSDALGIDASVLQYAGNGRQTEIGKAMAMNRALWSGSLGHYMEEMFDTLFTYDNIRRTEQFFTRYCFGRGSLPSVRVGLQPYGILPTTAFSRLKLYDSLPPLTAAEVEFAASQPMLGAALDAKMQIRFEYRLHELLKLILPEFRRLAAAEVMTYQKLNASQQHASRFVEMLCLHPVSLNYVYRQSINIARGPNANTDGFSTNFSATDAFGPNGFFETFKMHILQGVFTQSFNFLDEHLAPSTPNWQREDMAFSRIKQQLTDSRNFGNRHLVNTPIINRELVSKAESSWEKPLPNLSGHNINYVDWILQQTANNLLGGNDIGNLNRLPSNSLFFLMLRQSLLQAYQEAALNILQTENLLNERERRIIGNRDNYHFRQWSGSPLAFRHYYTTKWHTLFTNFDQLVTLMRDPNWPVRSNFFYYINGGLRSMANYLDQVRGSLNSLTLYQPNHRPHFEKLKGVRNAIEAVKGLPTAELELLMGEHADLVTHRLDAWMLGLVNMRLARQRQALSSGLFIGAWGYVENLRPDTNRQVENGAVLYDFNIPFGKTVYREPGNQGFIHASSISQAITAAVLRSAYLSNVNQEDEPNRLAVNISSSRVRLAMRLLSGMRNGQSIGALLGFQFERGLHERYRQVELDRFIQPLRKRFPLTQAVQETAGAGQPPYQSLTVDGMAMLNEAFNSVNWLRMKSVNTLAALLKENNYLKFPAAIRQVIESSLLATDNRNLIFDNIIAEIDRMADAFDALGDLAISESVYQIVQGNHVKAAAVMNALAQGKTMPPPEVIETIRTGTVVTQRILLNLPTFINPSGANIFTAPPGWAGGPTPRASAEPSLNHWLGTALGPAVQYRCTITCRPGNGSPATEDWNLASLNWQPIDIFCLQGGVDELKDIIIQTYNNAYPNEVTVEVDFTGRGSGWIASDKTVDELFILLGQIRRLTGAARPAGGNDLRLPNDTTDGNNPGLHDATEYHNRISAAVNEHYYFQLDLEAEGPLEGVFLGSVSVEEVVITNSDFAWILSYLNKGSLLGIANAFGSPAEIVKTNQQYYRQALAQLLRVYKESKKRLGEIMALLPAIAAETRPALKIEKLEEVIKLALGKSMICLPVFTPANLTDLRTQLNLPAAASLTRFTGRMTMDDWLMGVSKVRERMKDLQQYLQSSDMLGRALPAIQPVQLPYRNNDYWLGMAYPTNYAPGEDKLSLVLVNRAIVQQQSAQAGLVVDEWVEIIPSKEENTGLVFNYDQPNATAPQSVLLAVAPASNGQWTWDDLVHTVLDTVEMSKIRAVEPDHINKSFLSHALHGIVSEVPPPQLTGNDANALGVQAVMNFSATEKP